MAGTVSRLAIEEILLARGLVKEADLRRLPIDPSQRLGLGDQVVAAGLLAEEQIAFAVSEELGYPLVTPSPASVDADLVRRVPAAVLRRHRALPLLVQGDVADVAFADPTDSRALAAVSEALGLRVQPAVATSAAIRAALRQVLGPAIDGTHDDDPVAEASGALRLHAHLLAAVQKGATALQVAPRPGGGAVSRRVAGRWKDVESIGPGERAALLARLASLVSIPDSRGSAASRAALTTRIAGHHVRLSASFVPTADGEVATVAFYAAGPLDKEGAEGLDGLDAVALTSWIRSGEGVLAVNDTDEDLALAFAVRLLATKPGGALAAAAVRAGTPRLEGALHVTLPGDEGLVSTIEAACGCRPDVLVVVPGPGIPPPRQTFLAARNGRRVVIVGAWRDEVETRAAWGVEGSDSADAVARWFVGFSRGADGIPRAVCTRSATDPASGSARGRG